MFVFLSRESDVLICTLYFAYVPLSKGNFWQNTTTPPPPPLTPFLKRCLSELVKSSYLLLSQPNCISEGQHTFSHKFLFVQFQRSVWLLYNRKISFILPLSKM